jgi:hypothetical protein
MDLLKAQESHSPNPFKVTSAKEDNSLNQRLSSAIFQPAHGRSRKPEASSIAKDFAHAPKPQKNYLGRFGAADLPSAFGAALDFIKNPSEQTKVIGWRLKQ